MYYNLSKFQHNNRLHVIFAIGNGLYYNNINAIFATLNKKI
jgi:hypothetical protein